MRRRSVVVLALMAAGGFAPGALGGGHMTYYSTFFVEHDDTGRSDEPDFARTSVLGPLVVNCVVDFTPSDPGCVPDTALPPSLAGHARVLAPGCSDDSGRRPSGLCGAYTIGIYHPSIGEPSLAVPPGIVGVQGMTGQNAPGAYSLTKATQLRFLDLQTVFQQSADTRVYVNFNRKLHDTGATATLRALDPNLGDNLLLAETGTFAWYGVWADKNGNGVIDHLGDANGNVRPDNEFVWVGKCLQFNGQPAPPGQQYCQLEQGTVFPLWVWPGNHHAFCGGTLPSPAPITNVCYTLSADLPAKQAICFLDVVSGGLTPVFCGGNLATFDITDEAFWGDPILGPQEALWPDQNMADRTGNIELHGRHWVYGNGWQTRYYDQSALVSTVMVEGPTTQPFNPESRSKLPYDMTKFHSLDVDTFRSVNPAVEQLLQGSLKPALRAQWMVVRDNYVPIANTTDQYRNNKALDTSEHTAPLDDRFVNPGWSREPNTALDSFPAAKFNVFAPSSELPAGEQVHRGWLNDYSGHVGAWHAFADVQAERMYHTSLAWKRPTDGQSLPGFTSTGGGTLSSNQYLSPNDAGQHQRTMEPGIWVLRGFVGAWRDAPHFVFDEVIDIAKTLATGSLQRARTDYVTPPDSWMGNIVNSTGTWKYRGYPGPGDAGAPECTIAGVKAVRYFAECNPYWSATTFDASPYGGPFQDTGVDIEDPQQGGVEFAGFPNPLSAPHIINVYPAKGGTCSSADAGTWTVPVIRWNAFDTWRIGNTAALIDYTGKSGAAAVIQLPAGQGSGLFTRDVLLLPLGNLGLAVCTEVAERVVISNTVRGIFVDEFLRDVDVYAPWA